LLEAGRHDLKSQTQAKVLCPADAAPAAMG
jgi:hypothetical protein